MKKIVLIALVALAAVACGRKMKPVEAMMSEVKTTALSLVDSLKKVSGTGVLVADTYEGTIPAANAPGQHLKLVVYRHQNATTGAYQLDTTAEEHGRASTFVETGTWTLNPGDGDGEPVLVLTDKKTGDVMRFGYKGAALQMFDTEGKVIDSPHNYTLTRTVEGAKVN